MYIGIHLWGICIAFSLQKPFQLLVWMKDTIKESSNDL